jgi:hypothetical protein
MVTTNALDGDREIQRLTSWLCQCEKSLQESRAREAQLRVLLAQSCALATAFEELLVRGGARSWCGHADCQESVYEYMNKRIHKFKCALKENPA